MPKFDSLGDRIKFYERQPVGEYLTPLLPVIIRLDGNNFHNFTKGLDKPFSLGLIDLMIETTKYLVEETNALIGYTQSDEITLLLYTSSWKTQLYFDGKPQKINSILAGKCSNFFTKNISKYLYIKTGEIANFDCRCFIVPTKDEAINVFVWREEDAVRNSIQMVGQANFSHKQLQNKSCDNIQEMLWKEKQINFNDFASNFKRGTYIQKRAENKPFTTEEIDKLPPEHNARKNPNLVFTRNTLIKLVMPPITKVLNKEMVFFYGENPLEQSCLLEKN